MDFIMIPPHDKTARRFNFLIEHKLRSLNRASDQLVNAILHETTSVAQPRFLAVLQVPGASLHPAIDS